MFCLDKDAWVAAAEAVFGEKPQAPGVDNGQSLCLLVGPAQAGPPAASPARPGPPAADSLVQTRQRQSYNAGQIAALLLEAQKAARGETRASNRDIPSQISALDGGRVVTGQDVGNWFRNHQATGKKRQRTGAGGIEQDQAP